MNSPIRSFCSANTCSTRARIFDFALLARRIVSGIARPFGFLRWMWLRKPFLFRNVSLAADRWAVSAHSPLAVLLFEGLDLKTGPLADVARCRLGAANRCQHLT